MSFDPSDIYTITRTVTIKDFNEKHQELITNKQSVLRYSDCWRAEEENSVVIESILLRIPVKPIYIIESDNEYPSIEGLQILCAIARFTDEKLVEKTKSNAFRQFNLTYMKSYTEHEGMSFLELSRPLQRRINETMLTIHVIRCDKKVASKLLDFI